MIVTDSVVDADRIGDGLDDLEAATPAGREPVLHLDGRAGQQR
jgi:hypothetical protein